MTAEAGTETEAEQGQQPGALQCQCATVRRSRVGNMADSAVHNPLT